MTDRPDTTGGALIWVLFLLGLPIFVLLLGFALAILSLLFGKRKDDK
jgi:hypothetical protein